jgi:hypothetical protein
MRSFIVACFASFLLSLAFGCGGSDKVMIPAHPQAKPKKPHPRVDVMGGGTPDGGKLKAPLPPEPAPAKGPSGGTP